jgi:ABC-type hemin transport system substrate-binding protein
MNASKIKLIERLLEAELKRVMPIPYNYNKILKEPKEVTEAREAEERARAVLDVWRHRLNQYQDEMHQARARVRDLVMLRILSSEDPALDLIGALTKVLEEVKLPEPPGD